MNQLLQHRAMVWVILCQAVVASFAIVSVAAEQPDVVQQHAYRDHVL